MANAASLDSRVEAAIQWAISIANDDSHGYSQSNRNGPNYDCSSFVSTAFKNGGFSVSGSLNTSSMADAFVKVGFTKYKKGDVLADDVAYNYVYSIKGKKLIIDFTEDIVRDCEYTYATDNNGILNLTGGNGTNGGNYKLIRK